MSYLICVYFTTYNYTFLYVWEVINQRSKSQCQGRKRSGKNQWSSRPSERCWMMWDTWAGRCPQRQRWKKGLLKWVFQVDYSKFFWLHTCRKFFISAISVGCHMKQNKIHDGGLRLLDCCPTISAPKKLFSRLQNRTITLTTTRRDLDNLE